MAHDAEMTLDTAVELAENYRTKVAMPFEKLAEVLRVAKDAKNLVVAYTTDVATLEGRLDAMRIEEAAATARVANAAARAVEAERVSDQAIQTAQAQSADARAASERLIGEATQAIAARRETLEQEYLDRKDRLDAQLAAQQRALDAVTGDYNALVATIRSKFGPG